MLKRKIVVIKLGSQIVVGSDRNIEAQLKALVEQISDIQKSGHQVILVSSGAIGLGKGVLNSQQPLTLAEKQAAAAIGQPALMSVYTKLFEIQGLTTAQVLLTAEDFSIRRRYLAINSVLDCLLNNQIIPIINENDCVSTYEMEDNSPNEPSFGDNDRLSALIAVNLKADLLILLTNVDGLYDSDPRSNPDAELIPIINDLKDLANLETSGISSLGRGGMKSKVTAACIASIGGVPCVIANGERPQILAEIMSQSAFHGTVISAKEKPLKAKKNWIGFASGYSGSIKVNDCARPIILEGRSSLLAVGITEVLGEFSAGQVIQVRDSADNEIARGLSEYSSKQINLIKGKSRAAILELTQQIKDDLSEIVVHKDFLVTVGEYGI